jgi:hypothetical protein
MTGNDIESISKSNENIRPTYLCPSHPCPWSELSIEGNLIAGRKKERNPGSFIKNIINKCNDTYVIIVWKLWSIY